MISNKEVAGDLDVELQVELKTYRENLERLLAEQQEGKYVVIHGTEIAGVWDTYDDALGAAYAKYGLERFLVKKVEANESVQFLNRDITPCPS